MAYSEIRYINGYSIEDTEGRKQIQEIKKNIDKLQTKDEFDNTIGDWKTTHPNETITEAIDGISIPDVSGFVTESDFNIKENAQDDAINEKADKNHTHNSMTAATSNSVGQSGFTPSVPAGKQNGFLRGDATWVETDKNLETENAPADGKAVGDKISSLRSKVTRSYATKAEMVADEDIKAGDFLSLYGDTAVGDSGSGMYQAVTETSTNAVALQNGLFAKPFEFQAQDAKLFNNPRSTVLTANVSTSSPDATTIVFWASGNYVENHINFGEITYSSTPTKNISYNIRPTLSSVYGVEESSNHAGALITQIGIKNNSDSYTIQVNDTSVPGQDIIGFVGPSETKFFNFLNVSTNGYAEIVKRFASYKDTPWYNKFVLIGHAFVSEQDDYDLYILKLPDDGYVQNATNLVDVPTTISTISPPTKNTIHVYALNALYASNTAKIGTTHYRWTVTNNSTNTVTIKKEETGVVLAQVSPTDKVTINVIVASNGTVDFRTYSI